MIWHFKREQRETDSYQETNGNRGVPVDTVSGQHSTQQLFGNWSSGLLPFSGQWQSQFTWYNRVLEGKRWHSQSAVCEQNWIKGLVPIYKEVKETMGGTQWPRAAEGSAVTSLRRPEEGGESVVTGAQDREGGWERVLNRSAAPTGHPAGRQPRKEFASLSPQHRSPGGLPVFLDFPSEARG